MKDEEILIPHEVVGLVTMQNMSMVRAWRTHLGLTQAEVAERAGMKTAAYARLEDKASPPDMAELKRIAGAMEIAWEQLQE